jgi:hypothetical protein
MTPDEARARALDLMQKCGDRVAQLRPDSAVWSGPMGNVAALAEHNLASYRAVELLLSNRFASQANVVARTLMWDSMSLTHIANAPDPETAAFNWARSSILEEIGLLHAALPRAISGGDATELQRNLDERVAERALLEEAMRTRRMKIKRFPDAANIAHQSGQLQAKWLMDGLSKHVHTSRHALAFVTAHDGRGGVLIGLRDEPLHAVQVAMVASAAFSAGALAAARALRYDAEDQLADLKAGIRESFEELYDVAGIGVTWQ